MQARLLLVEDDRNLAHVLADLFKAQEFAVEHTDDGNEAVVRLSSGAFDFVVNFATPFTYDPSLGNLLMDIEINSPSSATAIFSAGLPDPNLGRVYNVGGNGSPTAGPNSGLDTLFTGSSVPDSSSSAFLLGLGIVGLSSVRRVIGLQQRVKLRMAETLRQNFGG